MNVLCVFWSILELRATIALNSALQVQGKAVFITGCDSGFGHALAKHLHKLGFTVFAGCLLKVQVMNRSSIAKGAIMTRLVVLAGSRRRRCERTGGLWLGSHERCPTRCV